MKANQCHANALREYANNFRLFQQSQPNNVPLYLNGYTDVMYLIGDLVKVCLVALSANGYSGQAHIPEPNTNIEGVLKLVLDLIPYEEAELLDHIRTEIESSLKIKFDDNYYFLIPPSELMN